MPNEDTLSWALSTFHATPLQKLILVILARNSEIKSLDRIPEVHISAGDISSLACCSVNAAAANIKKLIQAGYIVKQRCDEECGRKCANLYQLNAYGDLPRHTPAAKSEAQPKIMKFEYPPEFVEWWKAYPKNKGAAKKPAFDKWKIKTQNYIDVGELLDLTKRYARLRAGEDFNFTPHAVTWLNQHRWEVVEEQERTRRQKSPQMSRNNLVG